MMKQLEKILMPIANTLSKNKVLSAIRDGFLISVPITIVGSLFLIITNFPIEGYMEFMNGIFGEGWASYLARVSKIAFDCTALLSCLGIGYSYTRELGVENKIAGGVVAVVSFLIITPQKMTMVVEGALEAATFNGLGFTFLGTSGMFLAMITAIVAVRIFCWATKNNLVIKLPDGVPPMVMDSFKALIPSGLAIITFFIIGIIFAMTPYEYAHYFIYEMLQAPLVGLGKLSGFEVIYQFLSTLFWFFGINGPAVTNTVFGPIHKALTLENYEAAAAGLEMTNIFTAGFSDFFCNFGGAGSTLGLVIMMAFIGKSNRIKSLGKLSLPAAIFGINEPIIFGLPIVLNPIMAIPFILTPMVNTIIGYFATVTGIIPITLGVQLPWSTPILFSGYLVTGSFMGSVVQLFMLVVNILIYYPFFRLLDKKYLEEESKVSNESDELDNLSFDDLSFD